MKRIVLVVLALICVLPLTIQAVNTCGDVNQPIDMGSRTLVEGQYMGEEIVYKDYDGKEPNNTASVVCMNLPPGATLSAFLAGDVNRITEVVSECDGKPVVKSNSTLYSLWLEWIPDTNQGGKTFDVVFKASDSNAVTYGKKKIIVLNENRPPAVCGGLSR